MRGSQSSLSGPPRVAIFHDNFAQMGGTERVIEALHRSLPESDLFSTLAIPERMTPYLRQQPLRTSWMQLLPWKEKLFRHYRPLYPLAVEMTDLREYDLIVTSCFGYAKGVRRRRPGSVHICYCHDLMRWDDHERDSLAGDDSLAGELVGPVKRALMNLLLRPLAAWERRAAQRPDVYLANSVAVAQRLKDAFGIDAEVIPPAVETSRFRVVDRPGDFYLVLACPASSPREDLAVDLAVQACTLLGRRLKVVGDVPDLARLESLAGPTVEFLGPQPEEDVNYLVSRCRALLSPGEEDFCMGPLEVNAAGRPVVAFRAGGAVETIIDGTTGVFFDEQTPECLIDAILRLERMAWNPRIIRAQAQRFDTTVFQRRIWAVVERYYGEAVQEWYALSA